MSRNAVITWIGCALWLGLFVAGWVTFSQTPATGDGFTRGMDRLSDLAGMQLVAGIVAVFLWWFGRQFAPETMIRRISRVPLIVTALLVLFLALLVGYAVFV